MGLLGVNLLIVFGIIIVRKERIKLQKRLHIIQHHH